MYQLLKISCFELLGIGKYDCFEEKGQWKHDIYCLLRRFCFGLLKNSCFKLFTDEKQVFFSQNVDVKIRFTLSF